MSMKNDDVAVIGMAGRFPGANSVSEFWDNLCAGKDSIRALSDDELRRAGVPERDIADAHYVKAGALLDDVDKFDPAFFKVSPLEAELMDPQVRLLLQCAWEALEDAGHARREAQHIGVFAGAGGAISNYLSNFLNRDARFERLTASPTHLGNDKDFLATYLSYKLNLTGPSMTVQTACSTSLVALHQARSSLLNGECEMALAGGVTVRVPHLQGYHHQDGYIFSKSGRVRPFDARADGVVFGSGLGLVLIKRLGDAVRDGDFVHAVIKGSAIGNDGKGKMSYAASSARGQMECVRAALRNADVAADTIGFIETHGTGTAMGDPEEVKALSLAFKEQTDRKGFCALGAVKANVGHLEAAAGIAGFIKAVLAVRHGVVPPSAHYETPNARIRFENTPFHINPGLLPWNEGKRLRRAAVNSLGVGGTNAFVIVEQHVPAAAPKKQPRGPFVVPLSAKTEESLQAAVVRLADFLAAQKTLPALADIAATLQRGREAMSHRVAFTVAGIDELKAALAGWRAGDAPSPSGAAADWVAGGDIDWAALPGTRRVPLPTYAFAKERCWIDEVPPAPAQARIHPLLHTNTSDLREQKYSAVLGGDESFLHDHLVRSGRGRTATLQKMLPGVAYLEMARAAIAQAVPAAAAGTAVLELHDLVWLQPIVVDEPRPVHIAVLPSLAFEIYTADDQIHCQGRAAWTTEAAAEVLDPVALAAAMQGRRWSSDEVYAAYAATGVAYGPAHRSITGLAQGEAQLLADLALPPSLAAGRADFVLHPSLMDGALQAAIALMFDPQQLPTQPIAPFALESLRILAPCEDRMHVWARHAAGSQPGDKAARFDIDLMAADGRVCVQLRGFSARSLGKETLGSLLATQDWQAAPSSPSSDAAASQVILCDLPRLDPTRIAADCSALQLDPAQDLAQRYDALALHCVVAAQALLARRPSSLVLLQLVLPDTAGHQTLTGLSGLFKTLRLENPQVAGQIVLVDAGITEAALAALLQAERGRPQDTLVRHLGGERQVAAWRLLPDDGAAFDIAPPFKARGVYLVTGGLGGLGLLFAREILARTPDATVVLTGRATPAELRKSADRQAALEALQAGGARVEYRQLDLEDAGQVERLVAALRRKHKQLNGVIHSAGMTADSFLLKKSADDLRRVLAPKTRGTWNLDQATRQLDLDFLVLFSSLSAALGNLGQADYAAANGFLDAFAAHRNRLVAAGQRHGRTLAIRWPLWRDGGMQPDEAGREMLHESTGILPMQTAIGLKMFYRSLALDLDQVLVMEGDLPAMQRHLGIGAALPVAEVRVDAPATAGGDLRQPAERYLCEQMAALLKLPAHKLDVRAPLEDYGIDSILALDLTRLLEQRFGTLSKTLFFEYLTIHDLAGYFVSAHAATLAALVGGSAPPPVAVPAMTSSQGSLRSTGSRFAAAAAAATPEPIAIVGLSGRYPESPDLAAFWRNLRDGRDCIVEIPASRWDWREYYSEDRTQKGRHFSKWGGFIDGVDEFDARFFNVSPLEAQTLDPQERLFLQHAWMAMEDAGCTRAGLQSGEVQGQVGVYAGVMYGEYQLLGAEASLRGERTGFASNLANIANRVSYVLNLHGPSLAVDTMCSSSLTAIHLACQDLRSGRTALGIAGGVNVTIHPNKYLMLSAGQFISGDGHCQSFGEGGDGYIPGEGVGVVLLKRLSDAVRDGNPIHGLIRGSALSHGGKTNGYTVPNPQAQAATIRRAMAEAGVDPRHVSYLEAHGTGTKLGDPIEIAGLGKVFRESSGENGFCLVGSVKSNIGHAEAAAGIAGLTKVLLQMRHRQIVPSLHSSRLNPHIDFDASPFEVNQQLRPWEQPVLDGQALPRIAGISSFGAGGSNAHLVVQEYVAPAEAPEAPAVHLVPLSARTAEQLRQKAADLVDALRSAHAPRSLASIAHTLQVGREAMAERLAVAADSVDGLAARLQDWLDGRPADTGPHAALAAPWLQGQAVDWSRLHAARPRLVSLPTYPFARQRYWVELPAVPAPKTEGLHPLVHRNTSDFEQLSYASTFAGDDARALDDALCTAMARAAIGLALPAARTIELHDVATARPAAAIAGRTVTIVLFDRAGDRLAFEVCGDDGVVHAQGRARCSDADERPKLVPMPEAVAVPLQLRAVASPVDKPSRIALGAARAVVAVDSDATPLKPTVTLAARAATTPSRQLALFDRGNGVFALHIGTPRLSAALIGELVQALHGAAQQPSMKLLMLEGSDQGFLEGGLAEHEAALAGGLYRAVAAFAQPLVAVVRGDARGPGLLVAALCDFMVCSAGARLESALEGQAEALLVERFGAAQVAATAGELRARGWACPIVPREEVDACAWQLAGELADKSPLALRLLKEALARRIVAAVQRLPAAGQVPADAMSATWLQDLATDGEVEAGAPVAVALDSDVISALAHPGGILEIRMADREAKNMFSDAFSRGLREAFEHAARDRGCKVVVLTGYDSYFSSGGTRDTLLAIHEGRARFTDNTVFQLPLACPLPVIAAMQGHGIGAGWALGLYADATLFSDESTYLSPYMGYGFTPGAGTTLLLSRRIGHDLARETLMTARALTGGELKARGLRQPVLPREQVLPQALRLARRIARRDRDELLALKQRAAQALREALPEAFEHELAMHERTFVGQADTLARIRQGFGATAAPARPAAPVPSNEAPGASADLPALTDSLRTMLAQELRMQPHEIGDDEPFVDLGLDSITGVTWIRRINDTHGTHIEAIKVYSHPTLVQLARFVRDEMPQAAAPIAPIAPAPDAPLQLRSWRQGRAPRTLSRVATSPASQTSPTLQPIAVIGMAGRFAKADHLDAFWQNLAQGRDCIDEVPATRWDIDQYYQPGDPAPGKTNSRWMGALDGHDLFDAAFFNVSPREARAMDPQQRVFLQACWHGIEHAGYDPKALGGSRCGVFVGASAGDYHQLSRREQLSGQGFTGAAPSILAARIAYVLDLHGPALSIDTACSSSLVAIASACDSLVLGGSDLALAGGVNVMASPAMQVMTAQVGMLSPQGRCFTFDARADGIANGEGVGVVLLKRLADAQRDGDEIHGVIEGWGVNQDGRTNGITAPNAESQARLQLEVYERFGIDPAGIQLVEAHGTGTALGDPIEVAGLKASFARHTQQAGFCALGSVKSSIGHCLTAAGISGTLKLLLALKHEQLPPTVHFEQLNPHIQLQGSPFYVNDRLRPWTVAAGQRRRGAVNSFGFSGTNAHLVIAQAPPEAPTVSRDEPVLLPLSAKTPAQLLQLAQDLLAFVRSGRALELDRIAFTLQTGRESMAERAAFVARDAAELERSLQAFVGRGVPAAQAGAAKGALPAMASDPDFQAMLAKWLARGELSRVAELWTQGLAIDWAALHAGAAPPRRIGLPVLYPFARERHWLEAEAPVVAAPPVRAMAADAVPRHQVTVAVKPLAPVLPLLPSAALQAEIRESLAEALFMQPSDVGLEKSFHELGLDSIIGVEWVKALNKRHGTQISATRVYDHPNVKALAAYIAGLTGTAAAAPTPAVQAAVAPAAASSSAALQAEIRESLAEALFMQPSDVGLEKSFHELGLDSIIGVEWVKALNKRYGTQISATRVYDHPNVKALAAYIAGLVGPQRPAESRAAPEAGRAVDSAYFQGAVAEGDFERDGDFSLRLSVSPETHIGLQEHVVFGRHLMPTDAYIELVHAAWHAHVGGEPVAFENLVFGKPLLGIPGTPTALRLAFRRQASGLQFFVRSGRDAEHEVLHLQGFIVPAGAMPERPTAPVVVERELAAHEIPTNTGRHYAPLQSLQLGSTAARGTIRTAEHGFGFVANPFALYGGLCTVINHAGFLAERAHGASDDQFLPYRIGRLRVLGELGGRDFTCHAEVIEQARDAIDFSFVLVDGDGRAVLAVESIQLRRVPRAAIAAPASSPAPHPVARAAEPVAIIGMACRYPQSADAEAFWENLKAGRDCVTEVPAGRWGEPADWYHPDPRHPHTSYSKWGGFLERIDTFDALFFGISPAEAELIDPQQRIFLEECWKAIESAGQAPGALSGRACGVYVGCGAGDYTRVLAAEGHDTAGAAFMGSSNAILAARIAYHLNLKGPALAIDTACSSSLVAVHLACESIRHGENELALAGGINLLATPIGHILTSQVGMPSRDGRSAAFDAAANGIVFSEGCGVLLLKSLSAAERDGDPILGVIQGSGINQDGKTNGITAPSSIAQAQLLRQVYERFGIDPARIGYVEAHGTATPLGDPIEVNALGEVFGEVFDSAVDGRKTCALGSVKSNIGHTGFAAGVAGIAKVLLCLKHRQLVPSIHYRLANPHIEFEQTPFQVNTELRDWESMQPRMAAVSSFGFSGTNAHLVIGEHVPSRPAAHGAPGRPALVPLSAKTEEQLLQQVRQLLDHLRRQPEAASLERIAHTLQVGRDAMEHRLAVVAASRDELQAALQAVAEGRARVPGAWRGRASQAGDTLAAFAADDELRQLVARWVAQKNLAKVADLWVKGFELDLGPLHGGEGLQRVALPTYPFAKERCWVEPGAPRTAAGGGLAPLHPLLHRNVSDLGQQGYASRFSGREFFLDGHRVNGQPVLPAVAYLEMARAALRDAMPGDQDGLQVELGHVVWPQPIVATEPRQVEIAVFAEEGTGGGGQLGFEVWTVGDDGAEVLHCQGRGSLAAAPAAQRLDLPALRAAMQRPVLDGGVLYPVFAALGLDYGPAFQGIVAVAQGEQQLLAELSLPAALRAGRADWVLHPSLMDSALQASVTLDADVLDGGGQPALPFALESLQVLAACTERMVAWVRPAAGSRGSAGLLKVDIDLCDADGQVCVRMRGFSSRPMASVAPAPKALAIQVAVAPD